MVDRLKAALTADAGDNPHLALQPHQFHFIGHNPRHLDPFARPQAHHFTGMTIVNQPFHAGHRRKIPCIGAQPFFVN